MSGVTLGRWIWALPIVCLAGCTVELEQAELSGRTMGTTYSVKAVAPSVDTASLQEGIDALLASINQQMSTWQPDSEISRFNRAQHTDWFPVSAGFFEVVSAAREFHRQTDGAFNATAGGLYDLWGLDSGTRPQVPDAVTIAERLRHTGPNTLEIDEARQAFRKSDIETRLDLSAIAKGYAVDAVANMLEQNGVVNYLVEIGGEVRAAGRRADGQLWRVAVERPDPENRSVHAVFALEDASVATSGDYRNFFEVEGRRYSHIVDPRTGRPPRHDVASVSVVAADAMTADALATAFLVMGREQTLDFADTRGLAVMVIERGENAFNVSTSQVFNSLLSEVSR